MSSSCPTGCSITEAAKGHECFLSELPSKVDVEADPDPVPLLLVRCAVYPLHSTLSNEEQQAVFSCPPEGVTKIIISTNIAETSVTIDDVVYVIDSGKMKEKRYDATKSMESLEDTWVSRANALQRKGRAGRVASGVCFHLFTSHCFQHHLTEQQLPEIQRVPLEQLCLRCFHLASSPWRPS